MIQRSHNTQRAQLRGTTLKARAHFIHARYDVLHVRQAAESTCEYSGRYLRGATLARERAGAAACHPLLEAFPFIESIGGKLTEERWSCEEVINARMGLHLGCCSVCDDFARDGADLAKCVMRGEQKIRRPFPCSSPSSRRRHHRSGQQQQQQQQQQQRVQVFE